MDSRISATELARRLGDVLGRLRYRGESFVVEKNGEPLARLAPLPGVAAGTLAQAMKAWEQASRRDSAFADDLERIGAGDRPPANPWA